ncbi:hypothetical protein KSS87_006776 [Heliosperma pusillum]|nr:hypothetical protein KSS87_006776 [Heliosperma pusillum]
MAPGVQRKRGSSSGKGRSQPPPQPQLEPQPNEEDEMVTGEESEEQEVQVQVRTKKGEKLHLSPGGIWFNHTKVANVVTPSIKQHYNDLYCSWKEVPNEIRIKWFNNFKLKFTYDKTDEEEMRKKFYQKCQKRLKDMIFRVTDVENLEEQECPEWMPQQAYTSLIARTKDPQWIAKSNICKANKRKHSEDGKIVGTHHLGSIFAVEKATRMAKDNKKVPTAVEVFKEVHSRGGKFTTKKDQTVHDEFNARKQQLEAANETFDENELFLDVVGGRKKGNIYGLGDAGDHYFAKTGGSSQLSSATTYSPGIISLLQEENKRLKEESDARLAAQEESNRQFQEEMRKEFEERFNIMWSTCNANSNGFRRDSENGGNDGASGSFTAV